MKTVLVIFFLTIQSSYSGNTETAAAENVFDTVQFYSANGSNWRIKTYATDQDIHAWSLGGDVPDIVALARTNTEKNYGDVLAEGYVIESETGLDGIRQELHRKGLSSYLEVSQSGFAFWVPAGTNYRSKSVPQ